MLAITAEDLLIFFLLIFRFELIRRLELARLALQERLEERLLLMAR